MPELRLDVRLMQPCPEWIGWKPEKNDPCTNCGVGWAEHFYKQERGTTPLVMTDFGVELTQFLNRYYGLNPNFPKER